MERKEVDDSMPNPGHPDVKRELEAKISQARRSAQQAQAQAEAKEETKDDTDREDRLDEQVEGALDAGFGGNDADFGMTVADFTNERPPTTRGEGGGSAVGRVRRAPFNQNAARGQGDLQRTEEGGGGRAYFNPGGYRFLPPQPPPS